MNTLKQIAEEAIAIQFPHIPQEIKRKAFEILENAGEDMVLYNKDPVRMMHVALYAPRIIKSRERYTNANIELLQ